MSDNNTVIKLENVSKRYNVYSRNIDRIKGVLLNREPAEVKHALKNVSLEVKKGERLVVMGVVDSGRSTLAKIIAGVTSPSKGRVETFGKTMNVMLDAKVGMDMEFSCRDNIFMKANIVGLTKAEVAPYVDEILDFAEVKDFADLPLKRAPKGTPAMLSLAVHLHKDADILILDEVFGGGGKYVTKKCEDALVSYLAKHDDSVLIITTNSIPFSKKVGTRGIVLSQGCIIFDGKTNECGEKYNATNSKR